MSALAKNDVGHVSCVGCDGPPYRIAARIIENNPSHDWAVLVPGLGHLHMNQMKTLFKVLDKIIFRTSWERSS